MRAAVMHGPNDLRVEEMDDPVLPEGGIVIDVVASAICGTDVKMLANGHKDLIYPRILGHEIVGRVSISDSEKLKEGQLVQVWPGIVCSECRPCRRGIDNQCLHIGILGFNRDGGFAQKVSLPKESIMARGVVPLPEGSDAAAVSLAEPLACCINGQELARVGNGDTVLIFGGGPIGCLHAILARAKGVGKVIMTEHLESRRSIIPRMLVDRMIDPGKEDIVEAVIDETGGDGVDVALMATPEVRVDNWLLRLMAPQGRISVFSGPKKGNYEVPFDVRGLHYKEIALVGAYGCSSRQDREAVRMVMDGEVDLDWLITEKISLEELPRAFVRSEARIGMKTVVTRF
ncbi:MAG: alcohol dehydrogenase catalytic domain-containing protein [Methanomassiliicoccales archaeon]|nr:MAG: alcohol dehydrogenase catalytic domain-containing protein [Methanomassiliicoccales archaeon]